MSVKKPISPEQLKKMKEYIKQMVKKPTDPQKQILADALRKGK
jgi:hypothetical protein